MQAARQSVAVTTNQYKAGTASALDVIVTQTAALTNERTAIGIAGSRMTASVPPSTSPRDPPRYARSS